VSHGDEAVVIVLSVDRRAVLDAAAVVAEGRTAADVGLRSAQQLAHLLHADVTASTSIDVLARRIQVHVWPPVPAYSEPAQRAEATIDDNPFPRYWARDPCPLPTRVSDHLPHRAWLATATYDQVMRPMGLNRLLGIPVLAAARGGPSVAVGRAGTDFTDRELELARAMQLLLTGIHQSVVARERRLAPGLPERPATGALTDREVEVLVLLSTGASAVVIATHLHISTATVRKHLEHVYRKIGVNDRLSAINRARDLGLL
jgi:DNA-binding CsgD family transcriptional regulator